MNNEQVVQETEHHWIKFLTLKGFASLFILPLIEYLTDEFVITNYRIVVKTGWLRIYSVEMNIAQIEAVLVEQSFLGRILGYGDIVIIGSGGTKEYVEDIVKPLWFRRRFMEVQNGLI
jgi:uncharacterized membrane protein YdbT with pleckstrin-like domain